MNTAERPYFEVITPELAAIIRGLPGGLSVLDVGCGSGAQGAELQRARGHLVVGIDLSEISICKARQRLTQAVVADIRDPDSYPFPAGKTFDLIMFADVLEHLDDGADILKRHLKLLRRGGHVLLSVPNVAIWNVRLALLLGRFNYGDTGTLDRTHLRFYTRRTLMRLVAECGLSVKAVKITPGIVRPLVPLVKRAYGSAGSLDGQPDSSSIMNSRPYRLYMDWVYPIESFACRLWPGLLAFQYVVLAEKKEDRA